MSSYRKYNGHDKYHFRFYRKNGHHPFIVVLVETKIEDNKTTLSGYMITHYIKKMLVYIYKVRRVNVWQIVIKAVSGQVL